jgi:hypothetical protein
MAHIIVKAASDGTHSGTASAIDGDMIVETGAYYMAWNMHIHDVAFRQPSASSPVIVDGRFNANVTPAVDLNFTSEPQYHVPDHDDLRIYPVTFSISWKSEFQFPDEKIHFGDNLKVNDDAAVDVPVAFTLSVLAGRGEHQQPDDRDDTADGTHGPNDDQHRQELLTDKCGPRRVHIYLVSADYPAKATLSFGPFGSASGNSARSINITLQNVSVGSNIDFDRDGCSVAGVLAIVGGVLGTAVGGPVGGAVGAGLGHFGGNSLDDHINVINESRLRDAIQSIHKSWIIRTP